MHRHPIFLQSEDLAGSLSQHLYQADYDHSPRAAASRILCGVSLEHATALRVLVAGPLFTSAIVVHRAQYEALVRAVWLMYAASDQQVELLSADLTPDREKESRKLPGANDMLKDLSASPVASIPYQALQEFRLHSWSALNSYVHAGAHPFHRGKDGYPEELILQLVKMSNALAVMASMQLAILTGREELVRQIRDLHSPYSGCLPDLKSPGI